MKSTLQCCSKVGGTLHLYTSTKKPNMVHRRFLNWDPVQAIHRCPVAELQWDKDE